MQKKTKAVKKKETPFMKSVNYELEQLEQMVKSFEKLDEQARLRCMAFFVNRFSKYVTLKITHRIMLPIEQNDELSVANGMPKEVEAGTKILLKKEDKEPKMNYWGASQADIDAYTKDLEEWKQNQQSHAKKEDNYGK